MDSVRYVLKNHQASLTGIWLGTTKSGWMDYDAYGYDRQRIFMEEHTGYGDRTKRYVGNCELLTETSIDGTDVRWLTCLVGPTGAFTMVETDERGDNTLHYILKDNLGSWSVVTDKHGNIEQELSFDAWGNLRNPETWRAWSGVPEPMFDRGFTGHEHLYAFGLINMNGRMYDPVMSSFLSVDAFVDDPTSAQGFNRYAYCMHNPLRYTDPSGWRKQGREPTSGNYEHWSMRYAVPVYEPRDYQNPYYLYNQSFFGNYEGIMSEGGGSFGGGGAASYGFESSYGYYVTHYANSVYNYCFPSSQLQLIRNWQDNPSFTTNKELREAGITNLTVGIINGQIGGEDGYRNSYYQWSDDAGMTHSAAAYFEYVGGHENNWYVMSNAPLWSYATFCYGDYTVPASSFGQYVGGMSTLIAGAAKETALAFKTPGQPIPKSPFTRISGAGTAIGIAGVVANAVYNYNQVQNGIMSSQEAGYEAEFLSRNLLSLSFIMSGLCFL